jgi:hypothetical protein
MPRTPHDKLTHEAQRLMRSAARALDETVAVLRRAKRLLRRHPDYGRKRETFPRWLWHSVEAALNDVTVNEAAMCLRDDLRKGRRGLRQFLAQEKRDLRLIARRKKKR